VDVPDELDISNMRSNGMQPDEQLLPETPGLFFLSTWTFFALLALVPIVIGFEIVFIASLLLCSQIRVACVYFSSPLVVKVIALHGYNFHLLFLTVHQWI